MAMNFYKKVFICEITKMDVNGESSNSVKAVMKSSVLGVIIGIQKFSRKTVYTVDDGTGLLNCVLWHKECDTTQKINSITMNLNSGNRLNSCWNSACKLLLNKIQQNEELEYIHGDIVCCMGVVKFVKGKLVLDINHHYKTDDVNAETLWTLDVISCHESK